MNKYERLGRHELARDSEARADLLAEGQRREVLQAKLGMADQPRPPEAAARPLRPVRTMADVLRRMNARQQARDAARKAHRPPERSYGRRGELPISVLTLLLD